jgi:hypothetical protein
MDFIHSELNSQQQQQQQQQQHSPSSSNYRAVDVVSSSSSSSSDEFMQSVQEAAKIVHSKLDATSALPYIRGARDEKKKDIDVKEDDAVNEAYRTISSAAYDNQYDPQDIAVIESCVKKYVQSAIPMENITTRFMQTRWFVRVLIPSDESKYSVSILKPVVPSHGHYELKTTVEWFGENSAESLASGAGAHAHLLVEGPARVQHNLALMNITRRKRRTIARNNSMAEFKKTSSSASLGGKMNSRPIPGSRDKVSGASKQHVGISTPRRPTVGFTLLDRNNAASQQQQQQQQQGGSRGGWLSGITAMMKSFGHLLSGGSGSETAASVYQDTSSSSFSGIDADLDMKRYFATSRRKNTATYDGDLGIYEMHQMNSPSSSSSSSTEFAFLSDKSMNDSFEQKDLDNFAMIEDLTIRTVIKGGANGMKELALPFGTPVQIEAWQQENDDRVAYVLATGYRELSLCALLEYQNVLSRTAGVRTATLYVTSIGLLLELSFYANVY